ncbi:MAG: thioredoxin domain-containing protein [Acidobacteria bacterium]|nr:thioredoxin domain-containing protein [Acidobacteriota bacterium]
MTKRIIGAALAALVLVAAPACAQTSEIETLRRELEAVREDLANLRASIGRPRPFVDLSVGPQMGNPDALVALVEFSDYECPFCIRHFRETMPLIQKNYIDTGKVLYAFRDFPVDELHPQAIKAHEAAQCGLEQDKFWQMHNNLFSAPSQHSVEGIEAVATAQGLDLVALRDCQASGRTTPGIRRTAAQAASFGATGTPAFFIGLVDKEGNQVKVIRALTGAAPFAQFAQALEAAIAQATAR